MGLQAHWHLEEQLFYEKPLRGPPCPQGPLTGGDDGTLPATPREPSSPFKGRCPVLRVCLSGVSNHSKAENAGLRTLWVPQEPAYSEQHSPLDAIEYFLPSKILWLDKLTEVFSTLFNPLFNFQTLNFNLITPPKKKKVHST